MQQRAKEKSEAPQCPRHPTYKGLKPPSGGCDDCWRRWLVAKIARIEANITDLLSHRESDWL